MNGEEATRFRISFQHNFSHELTPEQVKLLDQLADFTLTDDKHKLLLLAGYAGTGKTSMLATYVKTLRLFRLKSRLLAPTGRAAKVLAGKAGKEAYTIHKQLYRKQDGSDELSSVSMMPNLHTDTVFVVDEASMIPEYTINTDGSVGRDLLTDLIEYVYSGKNCSMVLLGDKGQLPPVGSSFSPALDMEYMKKNFTALSIRSFSLNHVLRQQLDSGILLNATRLRSILFPEKFTFQLGFPDLVRLHGDQLQDELENAYSHFGAEESIIITRSNKRANLYNHQIRGRILWFEEQLCQNDRLMVVRNNYYWLSDQSQAGFIANGEMLRVRRIRKYEHEYGFDFARIIVQLEDYPEEPEFEVLVLLESIDTEGPSLPRDRLKALFFAVEKDYSDEPNKRKRYQKVLKDPYFNALQVKYAYAVTCHKSQGGQWSVVFVDPGYLTEEMKDQDYYRWLYTALTRATDKVFLVNFPEDHFKD